jgi:hypothetical protein
MGEFHFGRGLLIDKPTPSPPYLWNQRLNEKSRNNLWDSITYGQNLDFKELGSFALARVTLARMRIMKHFVACAQGEMSQRAVEFRSANPP